MAALEIELCRAAAERDDATDATEAFIAMELIAAGAGSMPATG